MKKFLLLMVTAILVLALAACGSDEKAQPKEGTKKEETSELTLEEVFNKAVASEDELKNFKATLDLTQKIQVPSQELDMNTDMKMDIEAGIDPLTMHMKNTTKVALPEGQSTEGMPENVDMEAYFTTDGFFISESSTNTWMKLPNEMSEELLKSAQGQMNATEQLEELQEYVKDFKFEQNDTQYILKLTASDEKFSKLIQEQIEEALPEMNADEAELLKNMKIEKMDYEIFVDKKTFFIAGFNLDMDITMTIEGEEIKIAQNMKSTYSDHNKVSEIKVPQEVLDNAISMEQ